MSRTSRPAHEGPRDWAGRVQRGTAVAVTALLHLLLLLLVTRPPPISTTAPQGAANGIAMEVTLLDQTQPPAPPEPVPAVRKPASIKKPKASRPIQRPLSTPVAQATLPTPPEATDSTDTSTTPPASPDAQADNTVFEFSARARTDDDARANAALAAKLGSRRSRNDDAPPAAGPDMGVDGFHVYYQLADEDRLRAWRHQGMTEVFLPLPGTLRRMVCPLEIALRRGSGKCRMVDMDSPELENIGDAREVIDIARVYQWGDMVWSGPGPYR